MTVDRIQSFLRENARLNYHAVAMPPFTLFFHPTDPMKYFNYAIPDKPITEANTGAEIFRLRGTLRELRAAYRKRGRMARFEFFEAYAPALPGLLRANGFIEEERLWSMLCTPATFRQAPEVAGLEVVALSPDSPASDIHDFLLAQRQGFNPDDFSTPTEEDVRQARVDFGARGWESFLGRLDGQPAGVSAFSLPFDGVSEVAGIATRLPFRRRGIAARLTALVVQTAFERGVQTACLTAADAAAGRVYERVGFQPFSTMLAYIDEEES